MSNTTTEREKALAWWDSLMSYQKYGLSLNLVSKNKELSFSEIEGIWNEQGNPTPAAPLNEEGEKGLKCTQGEWHVLTSRDWIYITSHANVCKIPVSDYCAENGIRDELAFADARLIAAAPDLYNALKECREWYEKKGFDLCTPETPVCFSKALSALTKASTK